MNIIGTNFASVLFEATFQLPTAFCQLPTL